MTSHDFTFTGLDHPYLPKSGPVEYQAMLRLLQSDRAIADKLQILVQEIQNQ
jgi:hypothetical protein